MSNSDFSSFHASRVAGLVLAGGSAKRMGQRDKALIELFAKPLITHALENIKPQVGPCLIARHPAQESLSTDLIGPDTQVVLDDNGYDNRQGPLFGILAGLKACKKNTHLQWMMTVACDTPFFPSAIVSECLQHAPANTNNQMSKKDTASGASTAKTIVLCTSHMRDHPTFALWPVSLATDLEAWLLQDPKNRKMMAFMAEHPLKRVAFPLLSEGGQELDPFFNINWAEDLERAEKMSVSLRDRK